MNRTDVTRRQFLGTAAALASISIVPRHVLAGARRRPPSERLNIACIGVGGRGFDDLKGVSGENIIALCDADDRRAAGAFQKFPDAKRYRDFRKLYDELGKQIDAVVVGTPDHTHAVAVMGAIKLGKHVYCEKPLAHSIYEVRQLMKAAKERNIVTQLGNQGHSFDTIRMFCEWVWDGAIGNVHTVHAACGSDYSRINALSRLSEQTPVPPELDWDLWLGPAQFRPYSPMYVPGKWRGWMPFGTGVIGDWVCHVVDPVFWALDLGAPTTIRAEAKNYDPKAHADTFPAGTVVKYEFPAKGKRGPVTLYWRDGSEKIPRPAEMEAERKIPDIGAVVLGDKGGIMYGSHGASGVRMFPESKMKAYTRPAEKLPRVRNHYADWLNAIRQNKKAGSDFSYGGPLVEIALLGIIAIRLLGTELKWDSANMRFTNSEEANALLTPHYRDGWTLG